MSGNDKVSYFNTLIFTIIASIVSLLLLAALFFEIFKDYMIFIVTVEVGIFCIIGWCIYKIVSNANTLDKYKQQANFKIDFTPCPDYYVGKGVDGQTICSNEYIVEDEYHNKRIMKIYPADDQLNSYPLPNLHVPTYYNDAKPIEKYDSTLIASAQDLQTTRDKCGAILGLKENYKVYSKLPLLGTQERCAQFT